MSPRMVRNWFGFDFMTLQLKTALKKETRKEANNESEAKTWKSRRKTVMVTDRECRCTTKEKFLLTDFYLFELLILLFFKLLLCL